MIGGRCNSSDDKGGECSSSDILANATEQANGLPKAHGWFTVRRQAMSVDGGDKVGVYFGTTSGEMWASFDEGAKWYCLMLHLPQILSVEAYGG